MGARAAVHLAISENVRIARCSHRTGLCLPVLVRRVGQREQEAPKDVTSPRQTACQRESPAPQPARWHRDRHISHLAALCRAKYIIVCGKVKQQLQGNVGADCRVMRDRGGKSEAELDVDLRLFTDYSLLFDDFRERDNRGRNRTVGRLNQTRSESTRHLLGSSAWWYEQKRISQWFSKWHRFLQSSGTAGLIHNPHHKQSRLQ